MKNIVLLLVLIFAFSCSSESNPIKNEATEKHSVESLNPSTSRIGDTVTIIGKRMDLLKKMILFNDQQVVGWRDNAVEINRSGFITHTETEISIKVPNFAHEKIMIEFQNAEKTVMELKLRGWIPVIHDFKSIKLVVAPSNKTAFLYDDKTVYRSVDGFLNWSAVYQPSERISAMFFIDEITGWIVEVGDRNSLRFYITEDGGETFNFHFESLESRIGDNSDRGITKMHFISKNKGFFVDSRQNMFVFEAGEIKSIFDYIPDLEAEKMGTKSIYSFSFLDENTFFLGPNVGGAHLFKLKDGEITDCGFSFSNHFPQIIGETGFCLGFDNKLYKSNDKGDSWYEIMNFEGPYSSFIFLNKNLGYLKSGNGPRDSSIFETIDGGISWHKSPNGFIHSPGLSEIESPRRLVGAWGDRLYRYIE